MNDRQDLMIPGKAGKLSVRTKGLAEDAQSIAVLVQGANLSGQAGYDFTFSGGRDYSLMDALVSRGIAAVTFSVRGYAKSDCPPDPLGIDTDAAIEDLAAVIEWLAATAPGAAFQRPHLLGWSWGGRICARYAQTHDDHVARLVLMDPALGGGNLIPPDPTDTWWSGGWQYFHDRLEPEFTEPEAARALADFVAQQEPKSPNGIRRENARGSTASIAEQIRRPTLMLYGSAAARQDYMQGGLKRAEFFEKLDTRDRALIIVPDCGDYAHLQKPRRLVHGHVADFLHSK